MSTSKLALLEPHGYVSTAYIDDVNVLHYKLAILLWEEVLASLPGYGPVH